MSYDVCWELTCLAEDLKQGADSEIIHEQLQGVNTLDAIKKIFRSHRITWAEIVAEDVRQIMYERERYYFVDEMAYARRYRENHGIAVEKSSPRFVYGSGTLKIHTDALRAKLMRHRQQVEEYGGSTKLLDDGCACLAEQTYFYQSQEWKNRAKTIRYLDGYKCHSCQKSNCVLHVHHLRPIQSAYSRRFHWNFEYFKLHVLCEECHRREHNRSYRASGRYTVGTSDEIAEAKRARRKEQQVHDEIRSCQFCFGLQPSQQAYVGLKTEVNFYE